MKYTYIAGLEHSGSTLLNDLLARNEGVLGLGEVGAFFSPEHMRFYLERWGGEQDARLCSCGEEWDSCPFWGNIVSLSGEHSDDPLIDKYERLIRYILERFPTIEMVVDSTKTRRTLELLINGFDRLFKTGSALQILLSVKDPRSFAASIRRKTEERSFLNTIRSMNWWYGENSAFLAKADVVEWELKVVLYEKLCVDTERVISRILEKRGSDLDTLQTASGVGGSHIVMGNKDFLTRNRERIRYDSAWFTDDVVNLAYLFHPKVRRLNHRLYRKAI